MAKSHAFILPATRSTRVRNCFIEAFTLPQIVGGAIRKEPRKTATIPHDPIFAASIWSRVCCDAIYFYQRSRNTSYAIGRAATYRVPSPGANAASRAASFRSLAGRLAAPAAPLPAGFCVYERRELAFSLTWISRGRGCARSAEVRANASSSSPIAKRRIARLSIGSFATPSSQKARSKGETTAVRSSRPRARPRGSGARVSSRLSKSSRPHVR